MTDICKNVNHKKEKYELGLYFDIPEHDLDGDDAPNCWLNKLTKEEYDEIFGILTKIAPSARINNL